MYCQNSAEITPKLDHRKLLGFRNLSAVKKSEDSFVESSDLAFNKIGSEVPAKPR